MFFFTCAVPDLMLVMILRQASRLARSAADMMEGSRRREGEDKDKKSRTRIPGSTGAFGSRYSPIRERRFKKERETISDTRLG